MKHLKIVKFSSHLCCRQAFMLTLIGIFSLSVSRGQNLTPDPVQSIYPSKIFQIKKEDPDLMKKLSLQVMNNRTNEVPEYFRKKMRKIEKSKLQIQNNFPGISISPLQQKPGICPPVLQTNFEGNPQSSYYLLPLGYGPSECDIAITNAGKIVSISNTWIRYYNENGSLVFSDSLYRFGNSLLDVHVLYDPKADRFVFCSSYGYYNADPFILNTQGTLIAFSKSNDPMDGWNLYQLPFTDFHDNSVGDYPLLTISDNEIFITLDYYNAGNRYKHVEILQINKGEGYAGSSSLSSQKYDALLNGNTKGTMVPAQGGSTTYGPNMYFIMSNESGNNSNKYYVYEITNTIASGQAVLNRYGPVTSNIFYSVSGNLFQPGGIPLWNPPSSDAAYVQNAFFENGVLQFSQLTNVNGKAAVCLGRITGFPNNLTCTAKTVSDPNLYLSFPKIAYAGNSSSDNSAIVGIQHTGATTFPGLSAVYVNSNFDISALTTVKAGTDTINGLWGDYSGICRRYNRPGEVWFEGQYGSKTFPNINWIAKLKIPANCEEQTIVSKKLQSEQLNTSLTVFPNPFSNSSTIVFSLSQSQKVSIKIFDIKGRLLKTLANKEMKEGYHQIIWNAENVKPGEYFLRMESTGFSEVKKLIILK